MSRIALRVIKFSQHGAQCEEFRDRRRDLCGGVWKVVADDVEGRRDILGVSCEPHESHAIGSRFHNLAVLSLRPECQPEGIHIGGCALRRVNDPGAQEQCRIPWKGQGRNELILCHLDQRMPASYLIRGPKILLPRLPNRGATLLTGNAHAYLR